MNGGDGDNSPTSPFLYSNHIYKWLENALDYGLSEKDFWEMTFAEISRAIESAKRREKRKASFDYVLADLIGRSISRIHSSSGRMPSLSEAYPSLFDQEAEEEEIQKKKDELSALRFRQFAQSYNKKLREVSK